MTWNELQDFLPTQGFEKVYSRIIKRDGRDSLDDFQLWVERSNALAVAAASLGDLVAKADLHYELAFEKPTLDFTKKELAEHSRLIFNPSIRYSGPVRSANGTRDYSIVDLSHTGLSAKIREIKDSSFSFANPWIDFKEHGQFLVDSTLRQRMVEITNEDNLTAVKLLRLYQKETGASLPEDIREILGYKL